MRKPLFERSELGCLPLGQAVIWWVVPGAYGFGSFCRTMVGPFGTHHASGPQLLNRYSI